jgi:AcrR family transcriptional regulator
MSKNNIIVAATIDESIAPIDRKSTILAAALEVFIEKGVEAATIDDIRRRCQASVGSIYHHFGTKEGVAAALYGECLDGYWRRLISAIESESQAKHAIYSLIDTHLHWIVANPDLARFLFSRRQAVSATHDQMVRQRTADHLKQLSHFFKPWLKDGTLRSMPFELYVAILMGPAQELSRHWLGGRVSLDPREAIDELSGAAWRSLAADPNEAGK